MGPILPKIVPTDLNKIYRPHSEKVVGNMNKNPQSKWGLHTPSKIERGPSISREDSWLPETRS